MMLSIAPFRRSPSIHHSTHTSHLPSPLLRLASNRDRFFSGGVYNSLVVRRVYPNEVRGWEHKRTTTTLREIAREDRWEQLAVPPVRLAYSIHRLWVEDGHHRFNAARLEKVGFPAMVVSSFQHFDYRGYPIFEKASNYSLDWNPRNVKQTIFVPEKIFVNDYGEIEVILPASQMGLTLSDIAKKLDTGLQKAPRDFLVRKKGNILGVQIMLQDVFGSRSGSGKYTDQVYKMKVEGVDTQAESWAGILSGNEPLGDKFSIANKFSYPLLSILMQQNEYGFISSSGCGY